MKVLKHLCVQVKTMYRAMADYSVLEGDACIHYFKCHFDFLCHKLQHQILERAKKYFGKIPLAL